MQAKIRHLRKLLHHLERPEGKSEQARISSGCPPIDRLLPQQGFLPGSLVEWLENAPGDSAAALATLAAAEACQSGKMLVVVDRSRIFYPPAAAAWGVDLQNTMVVHPINAKDEQWTLDQVLRSSQVGAVLSWPQQLDNRVFRRLQLAVESGGGLGLLIRPAQVRREPSWANVRLLVSSRSPRKVVRHLCVELIKCRSHFNNTKVEFGIDDLGRITDLKFQEVFQPESKKHETYTRHLASQLAHPKARARKARA